MDVVLEAKNVIKQYPQQLALDNLNLTVHQAIYTAWWGAMVPAKRRY